jgi:hypothetical protein
MVELKENSVKFLLMFLEASNPSELEKAIAEHKKTKHMKVIVEQKEEVFDFDTFDFDSLSQKLRKHIPALSDAQLNHAIKMCKAEKDQIRSKSHLIQVIIDHL